MLRDSPKRPCRRLIFKKISPTSTCPYRARDYSPSDDILHEKSTEPRRCTNYARIFRTKPHGVRIPTGRSQEVHLGQTQEISASAESREHEAGPFLCHSLEPYK